jgi:Tfp pilus assembly protein PilF
MERKNRLELIKTIVIMLFLVISTLFVYWQVQYHDFINYDDPSYVLDNQMVRKGLSLDGISWAFKTTTASNWHPLTWFSHMLDFQLFGKNPAGHHLTNLFLHLANTLLLFIILKDMTVSYWCSAFVAAMFALHPQHVESVAWVSERKDVLSLFFGLIALSFYANYVKMSSIKNYMISLLFYIMSLMSKPTLVTLPFVLVLLDYWPIGRFSSVNFRQHQFWLDIRHLLFEKIPFFTLSLLSCIITYYAQHQGGSVGSLKIIPISVRISNALISYAGYLDKTLWPRSLSVLYPYPEIIFISEAIGAALIIFFISIFVLYLKKRFAYLFVGWLWYLGILVPMIGIVQVGTQTSADRYTYVPLIGIFVMFSWGAKEMARGLRHRSIVIFVCAILLLTSWTFISKQQVSYWKNGISLFEHAISLKYDNIYAHLNLGTAYEKKGNNDLAMLHFQEALRIDPSNFRAINNIGVQLLKMGRNEEAVQYFKRAIELNPDFTEAHINIGSYFAGLPDSKSEAIQHFTDALKIDKNSFAAHYNLGLMLLKKGDTENATSHFEHAVRLNPDLGVAHYQLGVIYAKKKNKEKAIFHFREAFQKQPSIENSSQ